MERNPGSDDHVDSTRPDDHADSKLYKLSRQSESTMQITTEVRHQSMTQDMSFIKQKLSRVTDFMQKNSRDIELLSGELHNSEHCIQELIGELNCMQANMRRKNVKIDRLKDTGKIPGGLVDKVVQTLNAYFIGRDYTHDSIEHASRVGKRCWSLRPVIMCFPKYENTTTVMKNRNARQGMFRDGIRSPDITPNQHNQMQQLREEGQQGYLKEGKIVTAINARSHGYF